MRWESQRVDDSVRESNHGHFYFASDVLAPLSNSHLSRLSSSLDFRHWSHWVDTINTYLGASCPPWAIALPYPSPAQFSCPTICPFSLACYLLLVIWRFVAESMTGIFVVIVVMRIYCPFCCWFFSVVVVVGGVAFLNEYKVQNMMLLFESDERRIRVFCLLR